MAKKISRQAFITLRYSGQILSLGMEYYPSSQYSTLAPGDSPYIFSFENEIYRVKGFRQNFAMLGTASGICLFSQKKNMQTITHLLQIHLCFLSCTRRRHFRNRNVITVESVLALIQLERHTPVAISKLVCGSHAQQGSATKISHRYPESYCPKLFSASNPILSLLLKHSPAVPRHFELISTLESFL